MEDFGCQYGAKVKIEKVYIDGKILDFEEANIEIGDGVFETFRVSQGKVFLLEEHFARLSKSLKVLGIAPIDEQSTKNNILEIAKLAAEDAFIRLVVDKNQTIIFMGSIPKFMPRSAESKILLSITHQKPGNFDQIGFRLKSTDYLQDKYVLENPLDIMLDENGFVAEAMTANIFWAKDEKLYTSPLSMGILAGTLRGYLIKTNKVNEKLAKFDELASADEIFLTNGVRYIVPLSSLDGIKKPGTEGQVFQQIYNQLAKS